MKNDENDGNIKDYEAPSAYNIFKIFEEDNIKDLFENNSNFT